MLGRRSRERGSGTVSVDHVGGVFHTAMSNKTSDAPQQKSNVTGGRSVRQFLPMTSKKPPKAQNPLRAAFARRLEAARVAAGYETMREFAGALNIQEARYRRWEAAETEPDLFNLQRIAALTGVSLDTLICGQRREPA